MEALDSNSYIQLIQDIICGSVRRYIFTPEELDLLLDIQEIRMRKAAKNEVLRRYLRRVQQDVVIGSSIPLRLARFHAEENQKDRVEHTGAAKAPLYVSAATLA